MFNTINSHIFTQKPVIVLCSLIRYSFIFSLEITGADAIELKIIIRFHYIFFFQRKTVQIFITLNSQKSWNSTIFGQKNNSVVI